MSASEPQIDFSAIAFPSDKLSFGGLRKIFPELIDADQLIRDIETAAAEQARCHLQAH